jgi:hypothetical protein
MGARSAPEPPATTAAELSAWFTGSIPDDWFTGPVEVRFDRDEVLVTGTLAAPEVADDAPAGVAESARIDSFRESTRAARVEVALRAEERFGRVVSWAVRCGDTEVAFTTAAVPAMTRLRIDQRATLDTLIEAGVARSRSEALAWCVELVAEHEADWIAGLRDALAGVEEARRRGPGSR